MSDSAGTPWTGRTLPTGDFAGDDGAADPALVEALGVAGAGFADESLVVAAVAAARLFVAVVAVLGEGEQTRPGTADLPVDKEADMALVTLTGPDGRRALPVFSSITALSSWDASARPVPVDARRAAVSAVAEGCELMVLDVAGPVTYVVSRPALWAIGAGRRWQAAHRDDDVLAAIGTAVSAHPDVLRFGAGPGRQAQLLVTLVVRAGLAAEQVQALAQKVGAALQSDDVVRERVDGLELSVERD